MRRIAFPLLAVSLAVPARADDTFDPPSWGTHGTLGRGQARALPSPRTETLLSLAAIAAPGGFGAFASVSIPLDRIAGPGAGSSKVASYTYSPPAISPAPAPAAQAPSLVVGPDAAREAVSAAWRAAGLAQDGGLDSMAARARWSALLPEARARVLRHASDATHSTSSDESGVWYGAGEALVVEGRLTWRLDRLLFADEEPAIERLRLERAEARARVAARTLDLLSKWQRALIDAGVSTPGTADHTDALLRGVEAAIALDVMTDGWLTRWRDASRATDDGTR